MKEQLRERFRGFQNSQSSLSFIVKANRYRCNTDVVDITFKSQHVNVASDIVDKLRIFNISQTLEKSLWKHSFLQPQPRKQTSAQGQQ